MVAVRGMGVQQSDLENEAQFEGRANGDCTSNARSSSGLIDVGMCGVCEIGNRVLSS
jgi:hypothetical protein